MQAFDNPYSLEIHKQIEEAAAAYAALAEKFDKYRNRVRDAYGYDEAVDKVREETSKVKPFPSHIRSIEEFTEFMSNLPPCVRPSKEEWDEGMKRAEAFHRALNWEEK